jgi:hypothetical protein
MARPRQDAENPAPKRPPATTPQALENELIVMSFAAARKQIASGTASSQVLTHFLKLGTAKEGLERQKLEAENRLLAARVESMASDSNSAKLVEDALRAFRGYTGEEVEEEDDDR